MGGVKEKKFWEISGGMVSLEGHGRGGRDLWCMWVEFDWSAPPPAAAACDYGTEKPVSILGLYSVSQPAPSSPPISAGSVLQLWGGALPLPVWVLARDTQSLYLSIILLHPLALGL